MNNDFMTFNDLTEHLGVSDRALRRLVNAYSEIYGVLPRISPTSPHRLFPMIAVERLQAAQQKMHDVPGLSVVDALKALRDGVHIPRRVEGSVDADNLALVMTELHILRSEVTNLRAELAGLKALLWAMAQQQGLTVLPSEFLELIPDKPANIVPTWKSSPMRLGDSQRSAGAQLGPARLLSDLEAGYTLLEVRGDVILLTPSGQQVRLVDPRTIAALVKQGHLVRDGRGFCLTALRSSEG